MAVSVLSAQRPIQERPQPKEREYDFIDNIMRGLNIASSIYGIKHNITQNEVLGLQKTKLESDISSDVETRKSATEKMAKMKDPNSIQSQTYRNEYERLYGKPADPNVSAYDLMDLFETKKIKEIETGANLRAEGQAKVEGIRTENKNKQTAAQEVAKTEAEKKKTKKELAELNIPGYQISDDVRPQKADADNLRNATADAETINKLINEAASMAEKASIKELANPISDVRNDIKQKLTNAQLIYKGEAFAKLGVLAGPDMKILESVIENPVTFESLAKGTGGVVSRLRGLTNTVNTSLENRLKNFGYIKNQTQDKPNQAIDINPNDIEAELIKRKGIAGIKR